MNKELKGLLELQNPTDGQLIYMRDLYTDEVLINFMAAKWTRQFNTEMTSKDWEQWHHELEYLKLDSVDVLDEIPDWYNI